MQKFSFKKKTISPIICGGVVLTSMVLGCVAEAANLSFSPTGSQIDGDPILDILIGSDSLIDFIVSINTFGLAKPIHQFSYIIDYDPTELTFLNMDGIVSQGGSTVGRVSPFGINLNIQPVPPFVQPITTLHFRTVIPGLHPHDGIPDLTLTTATGTFADGTPIPNNAFSYGQDNNPSSQIVEVQQCFEPFPFQVNQSCISIPEPTATLSLLALGTIGAGATLKRKLKPSKSTAKETTKVG
jgi:hypothetical protein